MREESSYGKKVRELREARGWTQEHLATVAGVETRTVQRVEKDETKNPETLQAIAAAFDVSLDALRTIWRIAESRLVRTRLVTTWADFVHAEEAIPWQVFARCIMVPLKDEFQEQVQDLCDQVFADRDLIGPEDDDLWKAHAECIKEPLEALFNFNLAFYLLDERRDLILPRTNPDLVPAKDFIDDWRIRYFALVPRHGCFQLGRTVPLHRFNPDCRDAGEAFFSTQKQINTGAHVYKNAAIAVTTAGGENRVTWCDTCFPASPSGEHITFEYIEQVTGLSCAQLHELCEAITGEPFLEGLA